MLDNIKLKIGIGLPMGKDVSSEFVKGLFARINRWIKEYDFILLIDSVIPLDLSRNNIVSLAKDENCDYLFFIDSDILIEDGHLERLLSHNNDVVSGIYYQKIFPYDPLQRKRVAKNIYVPVETDILNSTNDINTQNGLVEVDGIGMGCALINMNVFDKIQWPWFEFKYHKEHGKQDQVSEDINFCQKLQDVGIKIYCDTLVQCRHVGGIVSPDLANTYKQFRIDTEKERDMTVVELSEFTNVSPEDVYSKWEIATKLVADDFTLFKEPFKEYHNHDDKEFYKTNKNYIFDLTAWHMNERRVTDYGLADSIKTKYPLARKILDFGSGCGENAIMLAEYAKNNIPSYDVSIADYDSYISQFARFRINKRGLNIKFYDIEKPINDKFDIILVFDVLEHVPDQDFENTIELLKSIKTEGGQILISANFGTQNKLHPMHYEISNEKIRLIESLQEDLMMK